MVRKRNTDEVGMLVVKSLVPGGPMSDEQLQPGDILVKINGELGGNSVPHRYTVIAIQRAGITRSSHNHPTITTITTIVR